MKLCDLTNPTNPANKNKKRYLAVHDYLVRAIFITDLSTRRYYFYKIYQKKNKN